MNTENIQNEIIENFQILDGDLEMTLNYLMELGEKLELLDEKYKTEENIIKGCQSKVWLTHEVKDGKIFFAGFYFLHRICFYVSCYCVLFSTTRSS